MKQPTLYLLPNLLDTELPSHTDFFPPLVDSLVPQLDGLIVENEKEGRHFLKRFAFPPPKTFRDIPLRELNEHTQSAERQALLLPLLTGQWWGLISDCGMPCLADPGAALVADAQAQGVSVQVVAGPSSILFALMLSGLSAQKFSFHGYLPKESPELYFLLHTLYTRSEKEGDTHLCIEAPYRNQKLLNVLLTHLPPQALLCLATDLTLPTQQVLTQSIRKWKEGPLPALDKRPTIFLFRAPSR